MELADKVDKLSLRVEKNNTEIEGLKETQKEHGKKIDEFQKFAIAMQSAQEARDKSLNRLLIIVTILSAVMPWVTKLV